MLPSLLVLCLVSVAAPAVAQEYQSKELADAARDWRRELIDSVPANKKQPALIAGWRRTADADYQAKRYAAAIEELTRAIANGADDGLVWLRLAQNELAAEYDHAMASAYNAYLKSTDPVERGVALFVIGRDYDRHDKQKEALAAFDAGLAFTRLPAIAERAEEVRRLAPLPATSERLHETFKTRIVIPDRKPQLRFSGTGYVLPKQGTSGLPLTTVNVDKVKLRLLRVNERNLVPSIDAERLTMSFSSYEVDEIINRTGSLVWEGEMAVAGERNRPVTTDIPLKEMLHEKGPGIYLAVAERTDLMQDQYAEPAANWVLVSDLGLAAYKGTDGLAIDVRSLADGTPIPGVAVRLYARNNGELAAITTDAGGIARIAGGLLRGSGGDEPFVVTAHGPD